ncbi:MAG: iron-sulfur cluster carrier protein ApbC [Deltaproteobacteria bacterium]|nr:iron-sulfur cluster carrier protein ApbC [Deltaproteobacteria bacterium]MBI3077312.1 iron-sulfur cluster carrier protein ApbC [Deltaproteobacteria bacterium]
MSPQVTEAMVLEALRKVKDPELHRDVVSLKMIQDLKVEDSRVSFRFVLTTPACPVRGQLQEAVQAAVAAIPGVKDVLVRMDAVVPSQKGVGGPREAIPGVKNTVAVASGKGGVGKSTVAVNLAAALAQTGAQVGLMDSDIHGPSIPLMMGVSRRPTADPQTKKILPIENFGIKIMSIGFLLDSDNMPLIWRGPMVQQAVKQFLRDVAWGELDYLIIDLPPGTGDAQLTLTQQVPLAGGVIVTTPQDLALLDAKKGLAMFLKVGVPVLGIVENMSYFICPHCGGRTDIFSYGGGRQTAEKLGVPFLGEIPIDPEIRVGGDIGLPLVLAHPESPQAEAFRRLASAVAARVSIEAYREAVAQPAAG